MKPGRPHDPVGVRPGPWAIAAVGALAVAGVAAFGVTVSTQFSGQVAVATSAARAGEVATNLIEGVRLVQLERGLSDIRDQGFEDDLLEIRDTTTAAVAAAESSVRDLAVEQGTPATAQSMSAQLSEARQQSDRGDHAFDHYSELIESMVLSLTELTAAAPDPEGAANGSAVVRLITAGEAAAQRRATVGTALVEGPTAEIDARLELLEREVSRELAAALALVDPELDIMVASAATGSEAADVAELVEAFLDPQTPSPDIERWRAASTAQVERLTDTAIAVNLAEMERLDGLVRRAETLRTVSVAALGAALTVSAFTGWAGFAAGRQRVRALREHVTLVEGLRDWFEDEHLPAVGGAALEAIYRTSDTYARAGGDWIEVYPLDGGRVVLGVGDVVGHGSRAVSGMVMVKNMLRGQAVEGRHSPAAMLARLDDAVARTGVLATLIYCIWDPERHTLDWINAGHVPGILHHPDGTVTLLEGGPDDALVGFGGGRLRNAFTTRIESGSTLVLYTDGLIETPGVDLTDAVRDLATVRPVPGERLAERLLTARRDQRDDVAILVVRF